MPLRTTARMTAFNPGQSPPPVRRPMRIARPTYFRSGRLPLTFVALAAAAAPAAGLLQVSPLDGLTTLTRSDPSQPGGGPERYYVGGRRTFLRLVPPDYLQAVALATWVRDSGARSIEMVRDDRLFGRELAAEVV